MNEVIAMNSLGTAAAPCNSLRRPIDSDEFRRTMGSLAAAVSIVTTTVDGEPHGCTVTAIMSLTADPPTLLLSLALTSETAQCIQRTGSFAVSMLADEPGARDLAIRFSQSGADRFADVATDADDAGNPLFPTAVATVSCRVIRSVVLEDHTLFVGLITGASDREETPLLYQRRRFARLTASGY